MYFILSGEEGETEPRMLKDPKRKCFEVLSELILQACECITRWALKNLCMNKELTFPLLMLTSVQTGSMMKTRVQIEWKRILNF